MGDDSLLARENRVPYIVGCGGVDRMKKEPLDEGRSRDLLGSIWRTDQRPFHLEEPGLLFPSFDGYNFPSAKAFVHPDMKPHALTRLSNQPDSFSTIGVG